ncbi:hypothetical protein PseAD21_06535 [Pseudomonas sp. AD21]|uniref:hypothetical protein n=1 Tax=Pseudomonas sp. AD21 TaxID=396378 RepID=UPI000CB6FE4D|nr:hypothetical protein [Pseudomonas sp. AD21]PMQ12937.1 hypothetical protein PseAD21_06535 [Pseudomonas sp. AD21]
MSEEPDDPVVTGWAAPTFSVPLSGTMQKLPLRVRCNFGFNRNGKWKVHIYNPDYRLEITGTHNGYYYEFTLDQLEQGPDCEIHTQFDAQGVWSDWGFSGKFRVIKPVTLIAPPALVGPNPVISGRGAYPDASIELYRVPDNRTWRGTASGDGSWSVQVDNLEEGLHQFGAVQIVNSVRSDNSALVPVTVAKTLKITSPANDDVLVNERLPTISGDGHSGTDVRIYEAGSGVVLYGSGAVAGNRFDVKLNVELPLRRIVLVAEASYSNQFLQWSNEVPITVVEFGIPVIVVPVTGAYVTRTPLFEGEGTVGAAVVVYQDRTTEVVGRATVGSNGKWSTYALQPLPPGTNTIVAEQTFQGQSSDRSLARTFKVRPPALTAVSVSYPTLTTAEFSGAGFTDATVEITIVKDPTGATPPPTVIVQGGRWTTTSQNWPIGDYDLKVVQKVSDNAGGWIPSLEYLFKVSSTLPPPTDVTHTITNYTPTFTGKGVTGASVEITDKADGSAVTPPATVTAQGWSSRALQAWAPGSTRTVQVRQKLGNAVSQAVERIINIDRFPAPTDLAYTVVDYTPILTGKGVSGATVHVTDKATGASLAPPAAVTAQGWRIQASSRWEPNTSKVVLVVQKDGALASDPVEMTISVPLLAPLITAVEDDGLSPKISGTCWPGATLSLKYSDSTSEHRPNGSSGTWAFKRDIGFAPDKEHTVTVIQTVAGRASPAATQTFWVSPEKPVITEPTEDADAHYDLIVRGTNGFSGATLQLRDAQYGRALGEPKRLTAHGPWFIELKKLDFRKYQIDAAQTIAGRESPRSDVRSCFVVLLPPVIEVPAPNQSLARTSMLSGTGEPFGQVTIRRENPSEILLDKVPVGAEGKWQAEVTLPVGNYTVKARQIFQTYESKDSPVRTYQVVPAAPHIESPGRGVHIGDSADVSGFGHSGDMVTVTLKSDKATLLGHSPVLANRTWSLTLKPDQPAGACDLVAVSSRDGFVSAASAPHPVVLGTYRPVIDEPAPGRWVENPLRFVGKGRTGVGRVVTWFDPEQALSADLAVTAQGWRGEATQTLSPGGHWCRFQQTITDGADNSTLSDWVESERFDVPSPPEN